MRFLTDIMAIRCICFCRPLVSSVQESALRAVILVFANEKTFLSLTKRIGRFY